MTKFMRYALLLSLVVLFCTACAKEDPSELLQTEHVPGSEAAAVHSPTPAPTLSVQPTLPAEDAEAPKVSPEAEAPTPTPMLEEPDFMNMYRAMPSGIRVDVEGVAEDAVRFCFCDLEITSQTRTAFAGQADLDWMQVRMLGGVRVLYYRNDGKPYICDIIAEKTECETIKNCFYTLFREGQKIENLMTSLPGTLLSQGYKADILGVGNIQYLYLYK